MKNDVLINGISTPSTFTLEKPHLFRPSMIELPIVIRVSALDFPYRFDGNIKDEAHEINIKFVSNFEDMTFSLYLTQPKSMICRKLVRKFIEEDYGNSDYNWVPNCFRHINT